MEVEICEEPKEPQRRLCDCCKQVIYLDHEVKVWTEMGGKFYHNICLLDALEDSRKYKIVEGLVRGELVVNSLEWKKRFLTTCDVWCCDLCGGRSGGYGRQNCIHCGAPAGYGIGKGYYITSAKMLEEAEELAKELQHG